MIYIFHKMQLLLGEGLCVEHEGSGYTCSKCKQEKTVDNYLGHHAGHDKTMSIICRDCLHDTYGEPYKKEKVSTVEYTIMMINAEFIQISEVLLPYLEEELRSREELIAIYERLHNLEKELRPHEELLERYERQLHNALMLRDSMEKYRTRLVEEHKLKLLPGFSKQRMEISDFAVYNEYNVMKMLTVHTLRFNRDGIVSHKWKHNMEWQKWKDHDPDCKNVDYMEKLVKIYYDRMEKLNSMMITLLKQYTIRPVFKTIIPLTETHNEERVQDINTYKDIHLAQQIIKIADDIEYGARDTPSWVQDFIDCRPNKYYWVDGKEYEMSIIHPMLPTEKEILRKITIDREKKREEWNIRRNRDPEWIGLHAECTRCFFLLPNCIRAWSRHK